LNQKYKSISQNVTANINLQKRDDYIKKIKDETKKYPKVINEQSKRDDKSEITSESHIKKVIKDIKNKEEKQRIIPRSRKERKEESDNVSESISHISHHSIKVTQDIKQKKEITDIKPRNRREDSDEISSGIISNMSRKVSIYTKEDKTKGQKRQTTIKKKNVYQKYKKQDEESEKSSESSSHIFKTFITDKNKTPKSNNELYTLINNKKYKVSTEIWNKNIKNKDSSYYLFNACESGNKAAVKFLLKHGADIKKKKDNGQTPLFNACSSGNENLVKYLVEHGADINVEDYGDMTPLFNACSSGN